MITGTLLAVLGILLVFVLWKMMRSPGRTAKPAPAAPPTLEGPRPSDLSNAGRGDVVSIPGAAEDFSDLDFTIDRRSAYQAGSHRWIDLSGEFRGRRVYLEVYTGAEVLAMLDARQMTIADLSVTEDQLADMDAQQNPSLFLQFEGKRWRYESSREIRYFENEEGPGEGLYRWLFQEENGPRLLCVEKWEGEPFEVRYARRLNPQDLTVYRAT